MCIKGSGFFFFFTQSYPSNLCAGSGTDISEKRRIVEPNSNSGLVYCVHFRFTICGRHESVSSVPSYWLNWQSRLLSLSLASNQPQKENTEFQTVENVTRNDSSIFPKNAWQFTDYQERYVVSHDRLRPLKTKQNLPFQITCSVNNFSGI